MSDIEARRAALRIVRETKVEADQRTVSAELTAAHVANAELVQALRQMSTDMIQLLQEQQRKEADEARSLRDSERADLSRIAAAEAECAALRARCGSLEQQVADLMRLLEKPEPQIVLPAAAVNVTPPAPQPMGRMRMRVQRDGAGTISGVEMIPEEDD